MPSYEKRKNGLWSVRFREIVDGEQQNKRLSGFKSRLEAEKAYKEYTLSYEFHAPEPREKSVIMFTDLVDRFFENQKYRIKESSYFTMKNKIDNHILPYFSQYRIKSITSSKILAWQKTISSYSFKYRSSLNGYLISIYNFGERYYGVENVMRKVDPIRNTERKKEMTIWSKEEFNKFIEKVDDPIYHSFFTFLYISGCRKGEAFALNYEDIDLEHQTVTISKNLTTKVFNRPYDITSTKNESSNRKIDMPVSILKEMISLKKDENDVFVFGGQKPLSDNTVRRKFNMWISESGVPKIRIHDLRHSCASFLIHSGVSIVAVSKRLGHANVTQTLNTYSHMMPTDRNVILNAFDG